MTLVIGLMSGTSLDGVDGVLVRFADDGSVDRLIAHQAAPFEPGLRDALAALQSPGIDELHRASIATQGLVSTYADVVERLLGQSGTERDAIACVAAHGQTVRHRPELGYTLQLNNAALLTELTGIASLTDFRSRDVAAGGQGAPLVPAFHLRAFGKPGAARLVVNLGGIANVTLLDADGHAVGYDIGPANVLIDAWVHAHLGEHFDRNGAWASIGEVDDALLEHFMREPFFALVGPRSTGRDLFNRGWLDERLDIADAIAPEDVQRTLVQLTVELIAREVERAATAGSPIESIVLCGGGAYNLTLVEALDARVDSTSGAPRVVSSASLGVAPEHVEAMAFAWLGWAWLNQQAGNLPAVTGARGARRLGSWTPV